MSGHHDIATRCYSGGASTQPVPHFGSCSLLQLSSYVVGYQLKYVPLILVYTGVLIFSPSVYFYHELATVAGAVPYYYLQWANTDG